MKTNRLSILTSLLLGVLAREKSHAQFASGSNGSYGAMNITASTTLQVPADGIFHCTTVTIASGAVLKFSRNVANTPVYLLATGDITFNNGGGNTNIDISGAGSNGVAAGAGGPGGFDGGQGGDEPGDGAGPGGGAWGWTGNSPTYGAKPANVPYRGSAGFASRTTDPDQSVTGGQKYGNSLLIPIIGGSGGGGGKALTLANSFGGGGGGGAIVIASNTRIRFAGAAPYHLLTANGGGGNSSLTGNGSGGTIRLVAPEIAGNLAVGLAPGGVSLLFFGGFGRLRVDAINRGSFAVVPVDSASHQYATYGSNMVVFPPGFPVLRIKQVGTEVIADNRVDPVFVLFPEGSTEAQSVKVTVKDFNTTVPLRAVVTPQNGSKQTFDFTVDNSAGGSTEGTVQVNIPAGVSSRVDVWTR